ncbi:MAG TPA: hypothetical protein VK688_11190 [Gemmatimonadales bacterium]|nr:hypothetical protein [Gemmatimonadales bacterium]
MTTYKVEQRRLVHRGREFHFVSYEATVANERRGEAAVPAMWYLMAAGKRRPVMEQVVGQEAAEVDRELLRWIESHILPPADAPATARWGRKAPRDGK